MPETCHLVLAHELLDNLPFRRLRRGREILVGADAERLVEVEAPADPALLELVPEPLDADETVVPVGALAFVDEVAARLADPGYALLIDYGGVGEPGGPVHGYRDHRIVEDVLADPGSTDITAGVDFALLARRAESHGLATFPPVTQRHALTALGLDRFIRSELARQAEALEERRGLDAVRTWEGRGRAAQLVDPAGLGRLRWLVLATTGSPAPGFVA